MDPKDSPNISKIDLTPESSSEPTWTDDGQQDTKSDRQGRQPHPSGKRGTWLTTKAQKITNWLGTSEPSARALIQHRKETLERAGISQKDPDARSKLHAPIGEIPPDAVHPAAGPSPEELARKKAAKRRREKQAGSTLGVEEPTQTPLSSSEDSFSIYSGGQGSALSSFNTFPYTGSNR